MKHIILSVLLTGAFLCPAQAQYRFDNILYGAAYYHEYMPAERLDEDVRMMKEAGLTVVRGASFIVNFAPDRRGLVEEQVVEAAKAFGAEIKRRFGEPVASSDLKDTSQLIRFDRPETFNHVVTMEELSDGQRISAYTVEAEINGQWKTVVNGQTIGHKRIDQFPQVTATALRFTVTGAVAKPAIMKNISIFNVKNNEPHH
ncbi:MAG: hypothetical protein LBR97_03130 [Dysgonamonadaceae bacterium]|jgi:alpha-L-fucosidase|nr:hypothetical protein [Dysgonamonadaceae bacterium]